MQTHYIQEAHTVKHTESNITNNPKDFQHLTSLSHSLSHSVTNHHI